MRPWKVLTLSEHLDTLPLELQGGRFELESMARMACVLQRREGRSAPGATRNFGEPDLPSDAPWAREVGFRDSYLDGNCFIFQLNFEDVPASVRRPNWPAQGVLWAFADLSGDWKGSVYFDPRPAGEIPWRPGAGADGVIGFHLVQTFPDVTPKQMAQFYYESDLSRAYEDWVDRQWFTVVPECFEVYQLGGWLGAIQGHWLEDEADPTLVLTASNMHFGDAGQFALHLQNNGEWALHVHTN